MIDCSVLGLLAWAAASRLADLKGRAHGPGGVASLEVLGSGQQIFSGGCNGSGCVFAECSHGGSASERARPQGRSDGIRQLRGQQCLKKKPCTDRLFPKMGECREVLGGGPAPPSKL